MAELNFINHLECIFSKYANMDLISEYSESGYVPISYFEFRNEVIKTAYALEKNGVKPGEHVAIVGENSRCWLCTEIALFYLGCVAVPLSYKNSENMLKFQIMHSECSTVLVSPKCMQKVLSVVESISEVKNIFILDNHDSCINGYSTVGRIIGKANLDYTPEQKERILQTARLMSDDRIATICYTTGTQSAPKGVISTYGNYNAVIYHTDEFPDIESALGGIGSHTLLILPFYHIFMQAEIIKFMNLGIHFYLLQQGKTDFETLLNINKNILEAKPTFMFVVPYLLDGFKQQIEKNIITRSLFKQIIIRTSQKIVLAYNSMDSVHKKIYYKALYSLVCLVDHYVLSLLKERLGGKIKSFIVGGAYMPIQLWKYFESMNIHIKCGYGMTEATGGISLNYYNDYCIGSVGKVLSKNMKIRIVDENLNNMKPGISGEILIKSDTVMNGYWKNENETQNVLLPGGWLRTGDCGYLNKDGFLFIEGRIKSMLVHQTGEKYCAEGMEDAIVSESSIIMQAMLYNNHTESTTAVLVLDDRKLQELKNDIYESIEYSTFLRNILSQEFKQIKTRNKFPSIWFPKQYIIADEPFTEENHQLANTKIVRRNIIERYANAEKIKV